MGFLLISVFAIFSLGLLDFIDRTDWEELDEKNAARLSSNKAYGVYKLRTTQPFTLLYIVCGFVAILLFYFLGNAVANVGVEPNMDNMEQKASKYVDTTQFALSLDNQMETPPSAFNQSGNNGDNMPQAQRGAPEKSDDNPREATNNTPKPEKPKKMTDEEYRLAVEKGYFDETGGEAKRKKMLEDNEKWKKEREEKNKAKQKEVTGGNGGVAGSSASTKGNVSVIWKFSDGRDAFEHNDGKVPAPAYTCGNDVDAEVKIKVKVDANGYVKNATIISTSLENGCIKQNALNYAYKARFEPSSMEMQDGTITYRYKAK